MIEEVLETSLDLGNDYGGLTHDLNEILEHLNLLDVTLVGFLGGREVIRYLSKSEYKRIEKVVLIAPIIL